MRTLATLLLSAVVAAAAPQLRPSPADVGVGFEFRDPTGRTHTVVQVGGMGGDEVWARPAFDRTAPPSMYDRRQVFGWRAARVQPAPRHRLLMEVRDR